MSQEKSLKVKSVPYMDARKRLMVYTQFLKRYWAAENGITLYKNPENRSDPWNRYEEISDDSFEKNVLIQCGTWRAKPIKYVSELSDRLKVIIDMVVGDVETATGETRKASDCLKKDGNRPLKLTQENVDFFVVLLDETEDVKTVVKRAQKGELERGDRHTECEIEIGLRSLAANQEMDFSDELIEKRIKELFMEESKVPRIYRDVMARANRLTKTVEEYAFRYAHAKGKYRDNLDIVAELLQDCEDQIDMLYWSDD